MHAVDRENISRLLKRLARDASMESHITFVAENSGMIQSCRTVLTLEHEGRHEAMTWLKNACAEQGISCSHFLQEVRNILQLFQSEAGEEENYAALGLAADATEEDVKRAYRRLSIQYHPDTAQTKDEETTNTFIRISRAYHAIIDGGDPAGPALSAAGSPPSWGYGGRKKTLPIRFPLRTIFGIALVAGVLVVSCLVISELYSRRVMLAALHNSGAAFVPPAGKSLTVASEEPMTFAEKLRRAKVADAVATEREDKGNDIAATALPLEESHAKTITPATQRQTKIVEVRKQAAPAAETKPSHPAKSIATKAEKKAEQPVPHAVAAIKPDPPPVQVAEAVVAPKHPGEQQEKVQTPENKQKVVAQKAKPVLQSPEKHIVLASADTALPKTEAVKTAAATTAVVQKAAVVRQIPEEQLQKRIDAFLAGYCKAYSHKNLTDFKRFFAQEATENGKPVVDLLETYTKLFESTEHIALRISTLRWNEPSAGQITLNGRFKIDLDYRNAGAVHGAGKIDFQLAYDDTSLKVQKMTYSFDQ
jgi:hypothetical protein